MTIRYRTLEDLPAELRRELPELAQREYLAVWQETWTKCHMGGISEDSELARRSHDAAMLAVQRQFRRGDDGRWRQAPVGGDIDRDKLEGRAPDHVSEERGDSRRGNDRGEAPPWQK